MSILIFRLNGVGDDEADDVRTLFDDNGIDYYETDAGRWGVSVAALWLNNEDQLEEARALLDDYQQQRVLRIHSMNSDDPHYQKPMSIVERLKQAPLYYLSILVAIVAVLYLSLMPFLSLT